jgi:DNA-3-methyladenine glycosylase I
LPAPPPSKTDQPVRCAWARSDWSIPYHDTEWGRPLHDDRALFELLVLEGAQAGLSWETILRKRDRYRAVFAGFDPARVARFGEAERAALLADPGIVRNRLKVESAIANAKAFLAVQEAFGTFAAYWWRFVNGLPIVNRPRTPDDVPATTPLAERISADLKNRGFRFVGPTIVYAFMQASGLVDDHLATCAFGATSPARQTPAS